MSRSNARSRRLRHRPSRVVPATIVAAVLLGVGVFAVIAVILRLTDGAWPAPVTTGARSLTGLTWSSTVVIAAAVVTTLVGLALLIAGLKPGRYRTARLQLATAPADATETDFVISRRAVARLAAARADLVDGVDRVSVSASGRRVDISASTSSEQADQIRGRIGSGVTQVLTDAGLRPVPKVTARVRTKGL